MEVFCCFLETRASGCTAFLYPTEHPRVGQGSVSPVGKAGDTHLGGTGQPSVGDTCPRWGWHRTTLSRWHPPGAGVAQDKPCSSCFLLWLHGAALPQPAVSCWELLHRWHSPGPTPGPPCSLWRSHPCVCGWHKSWGWALASRDPRVFTCLLFPAFGTRAAFPQSGSSGRTRLWITDVSCGMWRFPRGFGCQSAVYKPGVAQCCTSSSSFTLWFASQDSLHRRCGK